MKAFVTGGTGFIGSHIADRLISDPAFDEVRCLVRSREKWLSGKPYTRVNGDLFNVSVLNESMQNIDVLYHIAGLVMAPSMNEFERANVEATENILRIAQKSGVRKVVVLSSLAAAGPSNGTPVKEQDAMKPVSMYGKSKMLMEERIHEILTQDLSITIIRPPAVYGPREDQIYTYFKMMNNRICPIIGNGEKPRLSMIFVSDLIDGIMLASNDLKPGVKTYFLSGPEIVNWKQIKTVTSKVLGKKAFTLYIRPNLVKRIAGIVESAGSLFGKYPVFNREKANEMVLEWTCSNEKAIQELQYNPDVTLEEGISRTIH